MTTPPQQARAHTTPRRRGCLDCNGPKPAGPGRRWCDSCLADRRARAQDRNREAHYWGDLKRRYGITQAQYKALSRAQGDLCAVCAAPPRRGPLVVDHDHETGLIRGLLCRRCNPMIEVWMAHRQRIDAYLGGDCGTLLGPRAIADEMPAAVTA